MIWSWVLGFLGITGLFLSSRGKPVGFLLGFATQPVWIVWALLTGGYGFIPASFCYAYVYLANYRRWRAPRTPRDPFALALRCRLFGHVINDYTQGCARCPATRISVRRSDR